MHLFVSVQKYLYCTRGGATLVITLFGIAIAPVILIIVARRVGKIWRVMSKSVLQPACFAGRLVKWPGEVWRYRVAASESVVFYPLSGTFPW